jgi:D-alanyl-D-alanine carboxypeptidase/D-alanyl-D-alanine-endopeptidase (penicillin-binding protein 4)
MFNMKKVFALPSFFLSCLLLVFTSCSITNQVSKKATSTLLKDSAISQGHIGISIYEPATGKYWYEHDADKYFVPASNTKLFSLYAGMKYLGDSLVGLRYEIQNGSLNIAGTGDPTFLIPEFKNQPVFDFLKRSARVNYLLDDSPPRFSPSGRGWPWDDYTSDYATERSELPIYGNLAKFFMRGDTLTVSPPAFFNSRLVWLNGTLRNGAGPWFHIERPFESNDFYTVGSPSMYQARQKFTSESVPFRTISKAAGDLGKQTFLQLLEDTLHMKIGDWSYLHAHTMLPNVIYSQPTDSLFKPMMHRSDNFFAEQTLLMASNEKLGYMSDRNMIDTLLKTDLKDIPQKPKWVDGSGLSRYNLFTPQSFVYILGKMKNEFGWNRMKNILPTGGEGTISSYYKKDAGFIFAKTGTLSNNCALSGYLITKKNKVLVFSVLANNYQTSATPVRRAVEKFLQYIRDKY